MGAAIPKLDFVSIAETPRETLGHLLSVARRLKQQHKKTGRNDPIAAGKVLAMIFEKPSLRTRVSFEVAMIHLGGAAIYLTKQEIGIGTRESAADVARVLSGFCDAIMARTFAHQTICDLAKFSARPVTNGLSDYSHPCQAMADLMTMREHFGRLEGLTLAYVGDGNNVARSLMVACAAFGVKFRIATPDGFALEQSLVDTTRKQFPGFSLYNTESAADAAQNADALYTDTWVSMGQEEQKAQRLPIFQPYQINAELMSKASPEAIVLHCLPAYRGLEITDDVLDGPHSRVFEQAENRMHFQKGLLAVQIGGM